MGVVIKRADKCKCANAENTKTRDYFRTVIYLTSGNGQKTNSALPVSQLLSVACVVLCVVPCSDIRVASPLLSHLFLTVCRERRRYVAPTPASLGLK